MKKLKIIHVIFFVTGFLPVNGSTVVQKEIRFTARHNFKEINGVCEEIRTEALELQINKNSIQLKSPFSIIIPVISMKTGNASRDSHMLESLEYPKSFNTNK